MRKTIMPCYEKIEEIINDYDGFKKRVETFPSAFNLELIWVQRLCNSKRRESKQKTTDEEARKVRDISAKLIRENGIYGALEKVKEMTEILSAYPDHYIGVALGVIEMEVEEILETSLRTKFPQLLKLAAKGQTQTMIDLINSEEKTEYLLGTEQKQEESIEQTTLFPVEEPKKRVFRHDHYLRVRRKMGVENFLHDMAHQAIGTEDFSRLAGDMILTITESKEICSQIHPIVPKKLVKIASQAIDIIEDSCNRPINPDQISLEELPKVYTKTHEL